jgi:hypothetical protein
MTVQMMQHEGCGYTRRNADFWYDLALSKDFVTGYEMIYLNQVVQFQAPSGVILKVL